MALSKERMGEIALLLLQRNLEKNNELVLNPEEVKREINNKAKKLGLQTHEAAAFLAHCMKVAYEKTMSALESFKGPEDE